MTSKSLTLTLIPQMILWENMTENEKKKKTLCKIVVKCFLKTRWVKSCSSSQIVHCLPITVTPAGTWEPRDVYSPGPALTTSQWGAWGPPATDPLVSTMPVPQISWDSATGSVVSVWFLCRSWQLSEPHSCSSQQHISVPRKDTALPTQQGLTQCLI